jgi:hypothetical protein
MGGKEFRATIVVGKPNQFPNFDEGVQWTRNPPRISLRRALLAFFACFRKKVLSLAVI